MMRRILLCVVLASMLTGCVGLRFEPSEPIKENAAFAAAGASRVPAMMTTEAGKALAEAVARSCLSVQSYTGLPEDLSAIDAVNRLTSDDLDERAAAQAEVDATAERTAIEGAKRPGPKDVVEAIDLGVDAGLDLADLWLPLLGGSTAVGAMIDWLRRNKNKYRDALQTTVTNIETVKNDIPPGFFARQSADLDAAIKKLITAAGGKGPPVTAAEQAATAPPPQKLET